MFHLTYKDFLTPMGILKTDRDFVRELAEGYGPIRSFADEVLHRREHSLELQAPFMQRVVEAPRIVPLLIGSFHEMLLSGRAPQTFELYEEFLDSLKSVLTQRLSAGEKVCVISGVDMAHVGQQFGDAEPLTQDFMQEVESRDRLYLNAIIEQDKDALWQHLAEDSDRRRICGFPTLYTVLDLFERLNLKYDAVLYDYRQAIDYQTQCAVTFAGLGMYHRASPTQKVINN
jgi:AmmeMemoRadiSam system protein B